MANTGLPPQQAVQISQTLANTRLAALVTGISIDTLSLGAPIPPRVHLVPLPQEIWVLEPRFRGYDYFVVEDEVVIVEPRSHRVVSMIPCAPRSGDGERWHSIRRGWPCALPDHAARSFGSDDADRPGEPRPGHYRLWRFTATAFGNGTNRQWTDDDADPAQRAGGANHGGHVGQWRLSGDHRAAAAINRVQRRDS